MKRTILGLFFIIFCHGAHADGIKPIEQKHACLSIMDLLDYDEGVKLSLCKKGKWFISDIESQIGVRQVSFRWVGKVSTHQKTNDECSGYVLTQKNKQGLFKTTVEDLECK